MLHQNSPRYQSQRKSSFKIPAAISLETRDSVPDIIELKGEGEGNNELYYENTAFLGIHKQILVHWVKTKPFTCTAVKSALSDHECV
jgi:hypothetical protein